MNSSDISALLQKQVAECKAMPDIARVLIGRHELRGAAKLVMDIAAYSEDQALRAQAEWVMKWVDSAEINAPLSKQLFPT